MLIRFGESITQNLQFCVIIPPNPTHTFGQADLSLTETHMFLAYDLDNIIFYMFNQDKSL